MAGEEGFLEEDDTGLGVWLGKQGFYLCQKGQWYMVLGWTAQAEAWARG